MTNNNIYTTCHTLVVLTRAVLCLTSIGSTYALVDFENKSVTACKSPLLNCPISDIDKEKRELCFFDYSGSRCPQGLYYGCGRDNINGFLVEGCFGRHTCPAGSSNRLVFDLDTLTSTLECTGCDADHYQSMSTDSTVESLNGCSQNRLSDTLRNEMPKMVQVEVGGPTRPDKYACDVNKGYSDANTQFYCYVTRPCVCTKDVVCLDKGKPDLLPNGSCDDECKANRNPITNYTCASYMKPSSKPKSNGNLTDDFEDDEAKHPVWPWIVGIIVVLLVSLLILWISCTYCRKRCLCCNWGSCVKIHTDDTVEYHNLERGGVNLEDDEGMTYGSRENQQIPVTTDGSSEDTSILIAGETDVPSIQETTISVQPVQPDSSDISSVTEKGDTEDTSNLIAEETGDPEIDQVQTKLSISPSVQDDEQSSIDTDLGEKACDVDDHEMINDKSAVVVDH